MSLVNGTKLNNNYERAVSLITSTCAPREEITSRAKTYDFIMKVYSQFMDNSEGLGLKRLPDATFTRWEPQKGREKDVKAIRDANDKVMSFMEMLLDFIKACKNTEEGLCALKDEVKLNSLFFKVLDKAGIRYIKGENICICFEKEIGTGLIQLADYAKKMALDENGAIKHDREITFFSRIVFDNSTDWLIDGFDRMINADGSLKLLGEELSKRGFYREIYVDGRRLTLNYLKNYEKKPGPLKMSFGERSRLGFEVCIEDMRLAPGIISLRLPFFAEILKSIDSTSKETREFIVNQDKTCNGCRCCVRTDKTGTKPFASIDIDGKKKCSMYPSFSFSFDYFNLDLEKKILNMFDDIISLEFFQKKAIDIN